MTAIFLSHSSADNAVAGEVRERLRDHGHRAVFLDFDPENGIPAGREWEQELYARLRGCRVLVILCSQASMDSKWCFAEVAHARAIGKPVIPVLLSECTLNPILATHQAIDLGQHPDTAYARLFAALSDAGVNAREAFGWDDSRSPYPGLPSFNEDDAAVYFGRDDEIQEAIEKLRQLRQLGGHRFAVVLGASGSGKSSFVRAGLIPRLSLSPDQWLVVPPFRLNDPIRELSVALSLAFERVGRRRFSSADIRHRLLEADDAGAELLEITTDLREAAGRLDVTVLLVIDQFEEGFVDTDPDEEAPFHRLLRDALQRSGDRLMALATMRSDFLGELQTRPALRDLPFADIQLKPMSIDGLRQVIVGPAEMAGIGLGDGLVEKLLEDTLTSDALPLLAFTLRELNDKYGDDKLLERDEYVKNLGSLDSAVARTAERVLDNREFDEQQEASLRRAFLGLVRLNDEGRYVKQPAPWQSLPAEAHRWLDQFITARLLISRSDDGVRTLEVAHEALFRSWTRLGDWLKEESAFLLFRQRLRTRVEGWNDSDEADDELLRGGALDEAKRQLESGNDLSAKEVAYVKASVDQEKREAESDRRKSRILRGVVAAVAVITLVAMLAGYGIYRSNKQQTALRLVSESSEMLAGTRPGGDVRALQQLIAADVLGATGAAGVANARRDLRKIVENPVQKDGSITPVFTSAVSGAGVIAARGADNVLRLWDEESGKLKQRIPLDVTGPKDLATREWEVAFGAGGSVVATGVGNHNSTLQLWDVEHGNPLQNKDFGSPVLSIAFDGTGDRVVVGCQDGTVRIWNRTKPDDTLTLGRHQLDDKGQPVQSVTFDAAGDLVASAGSEGAVRLWNPEQKGQLAQDPPQSVLTGDTHKLLSVAFRPDGKQLLTGRNDGELNLYDVPSLKVTATITPTPDALYAVAYNDDGSQLVTGSAGGTVQLWDPMLKPLGPPLAGHHGEVRSVAFDPKRPIIVSGSADGTVREWDLLAALPVPTSQPEVRAVAVGNDVVVSGGTDGTVRMWDATSGRPEGSLPVPASPPYTHAVDALALTSDGNQLVLGRNDGHVELWDLRASPPSRELLPEGQVDVLPDSREARAWTVAISHDDKYIASGSRDGVIRVWNARTKRAVSAVQARTNSSGNGMPQDMFSIAFNPANDQLASVSQGSDSTLQLWDPETLRPIGEPTVVAAGYGNYGVAFSPTGDRIVTASYDGGVRVFTVGAKPEQIQQLSGDLNPATSVAFSPDGRWIVSGNTVGAVRVWSGQSYQPMGAPLQGQKHWIPSIAFRPDGTAFVAGSNDGTIHFWAAEFDPKTVLCKKLNTSMDKVQWADWVQQHDWVSLSLLYQPMCDWPTTPQN